MKDKEKVAVNVWLTKSVIKRWHQYALENEMKKSIALESIVKKATKRNDTERPCRAKAR